MRHPVVACCSNQSVPWCIMTPWHFGGTFYGLAVMSPITLLQVFAFVQTFKSGFEGNPGCKRGSGKRYSDIQIHF